jgi:HK97 family phage prohead protease
MSDPSQNSKYRYMVQCIDELTADGFSEDEAEAECELRWAEANPTPQRSASAIIHKTHSGGNAGSLNYVLSDDSTDLAGDRILATGWDLRQFLRNPVALAWHDARHPVGTWRDVKVVGNELRGRLELAPRGTTQMADDVRRLIEAGVLKSVSVGFRSLEDEPLPGGRGTLFRRARLMEVSVVSLGMNENALQIARGLNLSPAVRAMVFKRAEPTISTRAKLQTEFDRANAALKRECDKLKALRQDEGEPARHLYRARSLGFAAGPIDEYERAERAVVAQIELGEARRLQLRIKNQRGRVDLAEMKLARAADALLRFDGKGGRR